MYFILHSNFEVGLATQEPPSGVCWKRQVYLGETFAQNQQYLTLVACRKHNPYNFPLSPLPIYNVPLLKSNLQKAVRRGATEAAVATAWQLAQQDPQELLRRLPIIALEDGFLNTHILPRLVWWLLATGKGWGLSEDEWQRFLLDVAVMATIEFSPWREDLTSIRTDRSIPIDSLFPLGSQHDPRRTALFAIWLRSLWRGMLGDMGMLRGLWHLWFRRFASSDAAAAWSLAARDPAEACILLAPLETLRFDVAQHALPEAVDYHCVPNMSFELSKLVFAPKQIAERSSTRDIEQALWVCRSSLNFRRIYEPTVVGPVAPDPKVQALFRRIEIYLASFVFRAWLPTVEMNEKKKRQTSIWHYIREV